eukprot:SAG11_NODE_8020_length_1078_cov_1.054639_2_plen_52_part_00
MTPVLVGTGKRLRTYRLPNPGQLQMDEHPWLRRLPAALDGVGLGKATRLYV